MSNNTKKPSTEVRIGSVKAAVWANDTSVGTRYNVTLSRIYKDGEEWKSSDSLGRDDLLTACKVLDRAHSWIVDQAD